MQAQEELRREARIEELRRRKHVASAAIEDGRGAVILYTGRHLYLWDGGGIAAIGTEDALSRPIGQAGSAGHAKAAMAAHAKIAAAEDWIIEAAFEQVGADDSKMRAVEGPIIDGGLTAAHLQAMLAAAIKAGCEIPARLVMLVRECDALEREAA